MSEFTNHGSSISRKRAFRAFLERLENRLAPAAGFFNENFSDDLNASTPGFDSWDSDPTTTQPDALRILNNLQTTDGVFNGTTPGGTRWSIEQGSAPSPPHALLLTARGGPSDPGALFLFPTPGTQGGYATDEHVASFAVSVSGWGRVRAIGANGIVDVQTSGPAWQRVVINSEQLTPAGLELGPIQSVSFLMSVELLAVDDLTVEVVRDLQQPTTVSWVVDADGFWDDPANWSTGSVPGPDDDVVIDRPAGSFTIAHRQGNNMVRSLHSAEALVVSGGVLTVANTVQIDNAFRLENGVFGGGTIAAGATVLLAGGVLRDATTLLGATIQGTASGGKLENVTIIGDLNLTAAGARATVTRGLTVNGTVRLGDDDSGFGILDLPAAKPWRVSAAWSSAAAPTARETSCGRANPGRRLPSLRTSHCMDIPGTSASTPTKARPTPW